jgi:hypothetical protein
VINHIALETTSAHRGHTAEFITGAEKMLTRLNGPGTVNDLFKPFGFIGR